MSFYQYGQHFHMKSFAILKEKFKRNELSNFLYLVRDCRGEE